MLLHYSNNDNFTRDVNILLHNVDNCKPLVIKSHEIIDNLLYKLYSKALDI